MVELELLDGDVDEDESVASADAVTDDACNGADDADTAEVIGAAYAAGSGAGNAAGSDAADATADSGDRDADAKNAAEVVTTTVFTHTIVKLSVKLGAAYVDDVADGTNAVDSTDGVQMLCRDTSVGTALDASRLPISITISKVR
jgi:hypothetical protein